MIKNFLAMLVLLAVTITVNAIPAKPGLWSTIMLADGTEVRVRLAGDEHLHWMQAADGSCYIERNGVYEFADIKELRTRQAQRYAAKRRVCIASTNDGLGQYGVMSNGAVPSIGEYTIPLVMVQFADKSFKSTTTVEKMTRYFNEEGYADESGCKGSVRDYFMEQSAGMFVPTFDVVGIVTLDKKSTYYGQDKGNDSTDIHLDELPGDVVAAAVKQLGADFKKYIVKSTDSEHRTGVPLLCMLYAGKGQATEYQSTANKDLIWPCEWDCNQRYSGVHFNSCFVGNEVMGSKLMGMGVFCHEFGHALGLPDFYVTDDSYSNDSPFGLWSIMDEGTYLDNECRAPIGYMAYEKSYMGWLDMKEIGDAKEITLESPLGEAVNSAYIIRNPKSSTESFIFENRQQGTWYPANMSGGVMVSRIDYNMYKWYTNTLNNTQNSKRACILTADGKKLYYSAYRSNLYGINKKSIGTLKTRSGSSMTIGIADITMNSDGTATLTIAESPSPDDPDEPVDPETTLFYESFDKCTGKGGNDGLWSGAIAYSKLTQNSLDMEGWVYDYGYGADRCARFGTTKVNGSVVTPDIALDGKGKLTFKAGAWDGDNDGTVLTLSNSGGTVTPDTFTLVKGLFTDYTAEVTGSGTIQISFETDQGRFFLDAVNLCENPTGIVELKSPASKKQNAAYFNLNGQRVIRPTRGLYIVNGKKIVVR